MKLSLQCLFSPRLYKIYMNGGENLYEPQRLEKWSEKIITSAQTLWNISWYTSPLICMYIYKRGLFTVDESKALARIFGGIGCILALSYLMRAVGRACNPKYMEFLTALKGPVADQKIYMESIRKYDFEFYAWPATYAVSGKQSSSWLEKHPFNVCSSGHLPFYQRAFIQGIAFIAIHTFGLRLIYPGTLALIHHLFGNALMQGRSLLVEDYNGQRSKIISADENSIDTMFVDNRSKGSRGKTLVICCEGNSGFYEVGIMTTPIKAGYSALGWNHPGFATSTGLPYPSQEQNAIDAVMQYAFNELQFKPEDIVLFGWSIGGYSASWAAAQYPEVKALVLDATFDDLLPLALNQMPKSWAVLVNEVIRSYVDLNVAELVMQYRGPVQLVRRTEDEIICLVQGQLSTNRANNLLIKLIEHRHPEACDVETVTALMKYVGLQESQRASIERTNPNPKIAEPLKLIKKYMKDYKSSHCTPLPDSEFEAIMAQVTAPTSEHNM